MIEPYAYDRLAQIVADWKAREGLRLIAVVTRSQADAVSLSKKLGDCYLLTGESDDMLPDGRGVVVGSFHQMKGLEFDAVAVVWPEAPLTDGEYRRLYTACSRALHTLCLLTEPEMIQSMGIVL